MNKKYLSKFQLPFAFCADSIGSDLLVIRGKLSKLWARNRLCVSENFAAHTGKPACAATGFPVNLSEESPPPLGKDRESY